MLHQVPEVPGTVNHPVQGVSLARIMVAPARDTEHRVRDDAGADHAGATDGTDVQRDPPLARPVRTPARRLTQLLLRPVSAGLRREPDLLDAERHAVERHHVPRLALVADEPRAVALTVDGD